MRLFSFLFLLQKRGTWITSSDVQTKLMIREVNVGSQQMIVPSTPTRIKRKEKWQNTMKIRRKHKSKLSTWQKREGSILETKLLEVYKKI